MIHICVLLCLCCCRLICVFGEIQSVMEGNSVLLNTSVTEIHEHGDILWTYGAEKTVIAKINRDQGVYSTFDVPDGRFRDRLKLDNQTGSLTITNITTQHAGLYDVIILNIIQSSKTFNVSVFGLPAPVISKDCSSLSSFCSVVCSVVNVSHVTLSWLKGNSLLSSISVSDLSISLSLPLEVDDQDTNNYSCVINNSITHQTTHLNISGLCQTCKEVCSGTVAVIRLVASAVVGVATLAVVVYDIRCRRA